MTRFAPAAFVLASAAVLSAQPPAGDADLKALVGKWAIVKAELGGIDITGNLKTLDFQITPGGGYTAKLGGVTDEGTFTVDPGKSPRQMDIRGKAGPNAGKVIPTIYKLDGDSLTVCYELGGGDRPTEFKTKAGTKLYLAEYTRVK